MDGGPWIVSTELRLLNDVVTVGDKIHGFTGWALNLGGKLVFTEQSLGTPYLLAGLERTQSTIFQSTPTTALAPAVQSLYGARAGGGVIVALNDGISVDASLSELFAPYPIATHLGARASKPLTDSLSAVGGLDVDIKHIGLSIDGTPIQVSDTEVSMSVGLKYAGW